MIDEQQLIRVELDASHGFWVKFVKIYKKNRRNENLRLL
ncbi:hypothetical protein C900_05823 [Fulvivirga imtechensis AK7]|uniref:Uncharacterized protein n=1 Tax=Fulvivirga imtechensis AK7 TaxID=1237149 RepID=L8JJ38_9BACT|nr:hypothetical protein C900_05823 [Fulvivirga imtechensis AK7]